MSENSTSRAIRLMIGLMVPALTWLAIASPGASAAESMAAVAEPPDRILLIGGTTLDTLARHGRLEALLRSRRPGRAVTVVNLARSGGQADAPLGVRDRDDLAALVAAWKPGLVLVGLGPAEAEAGATSTAEAVARTVAALGASGSRIVIVAPTPCDAGIDLRPASEASRQVARERRVGFADLFEGLAGLSRSRPERLTSNGLALTPAGSWWASVGIEHDLGFEPSPWRIAVDVASGPPRVEGVAVADAQARSDGVRFRATDARLPGSPPPFAGAPDTWSGRVARVVGLEPGRYTLRIDGQAVETADEGAWARGVRIVAGPEFTAAERLRLACVRRERDWQAHRAALLWSDPTAVPRVEWVARMVRAIHDQERDPGSTSLIDLARPTAHAYEWSVEPARTAARR
jgi:hypothetical protein